MDTTEQIPSRVLTATDPHRPFWRREVVYAVVKQGDRYFVRLLSVTEGDVRAEKDPQPIDFRDVPLIPLRENGISTGDVRRAFSLLRQTDGNRAHLSTRVHAMLVLEGERIYAAVTGENSVGG